MEGIMGVAVAVVLIEAVRVRLLLLVGVGLKVGVAEALETWHRFSPATSKLPMGQVTTQVVPL